MSSCVRRWAAGAGKPVRRPRPFLDTVEIRVVRCTVVSFGSYACQGHCSAGAVQRPIRPNAPGTWFGGGEQQMQIEERVVDGVTILDLKGKMTLGEGDELL